MEHTIVEFIGLIYTLILAELELINWIFFCCLPLSIRYVYRYVFSAIRGNIDKMRGAKGWGDTVRAGFTKKE